MSQDTTRPSLAHRILAAVVPRRWIEAMEADSRKWIVRCGRCNFAQSVWDMGGIRYKAVGRPRWYLKCPKCGERSWHTVGREQVTTRS